MMEVEPAPGAGLAGMAAAVGGVAILVGAVVWQARRVLRAMNSALAGVHDDVYDHSFPDS